MSVQKTEDGRIVIICNICHKPMVQSKNDSELYCCYTDNERLYKSELKVIQEVVPKRESHSISYKDDLIDALMMAWPMELVEEPEPTAQSFNFMNMDEFNSPVKEDPGKEEVKKKVKELFPNRKVKIDFAH